MARNRRDAGVQVGDVEGHLVAAERVGLLADDLEDLALSHRPSGNAPPGLAIRPTRCRPSPERTRSSLASQVARRAGRRSRTPPAGVRDGSVQRLAGRRASLSITRRTRPGGSGSGTRLESSSGSVGTSWYSSLSVRIGAGINTSGPMNAPAFRCARLGFGLPISHLACAESLGLVDGRVKGRVSRLTIGTIGCGGRQYHAADGPLNSWIVLPPSTMIPWPVT